MFGKGIPMVTTALALSSVKSSPSLTFPLHTAISRAPSVTKNHITTGQNGEFYMYSFRGPMVSVLSEPHLFLRSI